MASRKTETELYPRIGPIEDPVHPETATVGDPSPAVRRMRRRQALPLALLEGTDYMRNQQQVWTPMYAGEEDSDYLKRLDVNFLFPGFQDAIHRCAIRPFAQDVQMTKENEYYELIAEDTDGEGNPLSTVCRHAMTDGVGLGSLGFLVTGPEGNVAPTMSDMRNGVRPRLEEISPADFLGWNYVENEDTREKWVTQIRIAGSMVRQVGQWGQEEVPTVRVINTPEPGGDGGKTWQLWAWNEGAQDYELAQEGEHSYPRCPLLATPFRRYKSVLWESVPPLLDIAWMNLTHWQSQSRQRQFLDAIRIGILWLSGIAQTELNKGLTIGPGRLNGTPKSGVKLEWVEHNGMAVKSGVDDLNRLEQMMMAASLEPFTRQAGHPTATAKAIDTGTKQTEIQVWVRLVEQATEDRFRFIEEWTGVPLSEDFQINIWDGFAMMLKNDDHLQTLLKMNAIDALSVQTLNEEAKNRGALSETHDAMKEIQRILKEREQGLGQGRLAEQPQEDGTDDEPNRERPIRTESLPATGAV